MTCAGQTSQDGEDTTGKSFDIVMADSALKKSAGTWQGEWIDLPHFALSGRK